MTTAIELDRRPASVRRGGYTLSPAAWHLDCEAHEHLGAAATEAVRRLHEAVAVALNGGDASIRAVLPDWPAGVSAAQAWGGIPDVTIGCHRCDMVFSGGAWRVIEVNSMNAGGWILPRLYARAQGAPAIRPDPARRLFEHLIAEVERRGGGGRGAKRIALIRRSGSDEFDAAFIADCRTAAPGWEIVYAGWEEIVCRPDGASLAAGKIRILLEIEVTPSPRRLQAQLLASRGLVLFVAGPISRIVNDKRWLALRTAATATVASSRIVSQGTTSDGALSACTAAEAIERQEELVLKKALSDGGKDVYAGRVNDRAAWRRLVARAATEGNWIVQPWLSPQRPPGSPTAAMLPPDTHLVFSPFVIGGRYAGGFVRVLAADGYATRTTATDAPVALADSPNSDAVVPVFPILPPLAGASAQ